jgi:hypothetical protein
VAVRAIIGVMAMSGLRFRRANHTPRHHVE